MPLSQTRPRKGLNKWMLLILLAGVALASYASIILRIGLSTP